MPRKFTDVLYMPSCLLAHPKSLGTELSNATKLVRKELGESLPDRVKKTIEFCVSNRMGYILSRNKFVKNCREARSHRYRLGHIGIPLYDELKSIVGKANDENGESIVIAMHCRGHMAIDFFAVQSLLNLESNVYKLTERELRQQFGLVSGTINPILLQENSNDRLIQVFDVSITEPISKFPGTMMTNAGEHTWAIEFDPNDLIEYLDSKCVHSIAIQDRELKTHDLPCSTNPRTIGIITGNGPDSGMALWKGINKHIHEILGKQHFLGDMSFPEVHVISVPAMGLSMELESREQPTWDVLSKAVVQLKDHNVDLLALACHTTHYFEGKIREIFDTERRRFVSMSDVVKKHIKDNEIMEMAVLGISYVANLKEWSAYCELNNYNVENIDDVTMSKFHEIGYEVKQKTDLYPSFQKLTGLIKNDIKSNNIIIALTELSILLENIAKKSRSSERNIIDALDLYAKEIAMLSLGLNWR